MYNGKWGKVRHEPEKIYLWGSWIHLNGPGYIYKDFLENIDEVIIVEYWRKVTNLKLVYQLREPEDILNWDLVLESLVNQKCSDEGINKAWMLKDSMENAVKIINKWKGKDEF